MKTHLPRADDVKRKWYVVDADGKVLGRMAVAVATVLRGKHKAIYTPSVDTGDHVIILNADKVAVTGAKLKDKKYYSHSGYPGGIKEVPLEKLLAEKPEEVIIKAVRGMLPKGPLGRQMLRKLKVYTGAEHPHGAQAPEAMPERLAV